VRVAIVGSTASGKSAVAVAVARGLGDVDLVSIDSMQVYRGMDLGTAKPTRDERDEIPHHLLDLVEPTDEFTVAEFRDAYEDTVGLFDRLRTIDPTATTKIDPANRRRIVRALEVTLGSGRPFSSFGPGVDDYPTSDVEQIGLRWPREVLRTRIAQRVRQMIDDGLVAEVRALAETGLSRTAAQALGYKETLAMLEGEMSEDEAIATITTRTRQFAVRQERWFRRDPRVRWIDVEHDAVAEATPVVIEALRT